MLQVDSCHAGVVQAELCEDAAHSTPVAHVAAVWFIILVLLLCSIKEFVV
jgi:uncharacterized membrane protein YgaE (UPF0421/DUF939 family)